MQLLDGKKVAAEMYEKLKVEVANLKQEGITPKLVIILVGDSSASLSYIKSKRKAGEQIGIETEFLNYDPKEIDTEKLINKISELNNDSRVNGILVQLPLPAHINTPKIIKAIDPKKDSDGFTAYNLGKMFLSTEFENLSPCTPQGIIKILESYKIAVEGKEVVVVGKSNIVGKPIAIMLLNRGATVTICHSKTKNLAEHTKRADILIAAVGKQNLIKAEMVKDGSVVIDVGINRNEEGKIVGDVDFENVASKTSFITPVPGGCGPMTVACLMQNVVISAKNQNKELRIKNLV